MKLIKYCNSKYHPKNCDTLQVGTLDYYRNHDNKFISDPSEATIENLRIHNTSTDKIDFTTEEINWISNRKGIIVLGRNDRICCSIFPNNNELLDNNQVGLYFNNKINIPNSYIFCCSQVEEPCEKQMRDLGYDSWYEIKYPKVFFGILTQEILNNANIIKPNNFELRYSTISDLINYGPMKNIKINSKIDLIKFILYRKSEVSDLNQDIMYWKNTEFRHSILFHNTNSIIPIPVEPRPLLINNISLLPYIDY